MKKKESVSICTVASFGTSSRCALKVAIAHTVGSTVTLTTVGSIRGDGTSFTPNQALKRMLELSGRLGTEVKMVIGDKEKRSQHEN